jgi:hypothetical protein
VIVRSVTKPAVLIVKGRAPAVLVTRPNASPRVVLAGVRGSEGREGIDGTNGVDGATWTTKEW